MGIAFGAVALSVACAPSFQTLYEGDVCFEHCYALDESPRATMEQKGACWRDWVDHHTFGQTRDRVEYAQARTRAIEQMPVAPTDEALMAAAPGVGADHEGQVTAPAPTNAFAPPPKVDDTAAVAPSMRTLPQGDARQDAGRPPPTVSQKTAPLPKAPGSECVDACSQTWETCLGSCRAGGKNQCDACDGKHASCLAGCVKKLKADLAPKDVRAAKNR